MLDLGQWGEANDIGNALRVGNDPDVQARLSSVLCDPNASEIIRDANFIATQHAPWDVHGPDGMGVATLRVNPDNTLDLVNNETNSAFNVGKLLNPEQLNEATAVGNALRVGNDPDVQAQLAAVLRDPDARNIINVANYIATTHAWFDVHGPNGTGVDTLQVNPNNSVDLVNKENGAVRNVGQLG
jgi:hypothetical protein